MKSENYIKIRVYGESKSKKSYVIDSYGIKKFKCLKSQVFFGKKDLENKIDNIDGFKLTENEKHYLLYQI